MVSPVLLASSQGLFEACDALTVREIRGTILSLPPPHPLCVGRSELAPGVSRRAMKTLPAIQSVPCLKQMSVGEAVCDLPPLHSLESFHKLL